MKLFESFNISMDVFESIEVIFLSMKDMMALLEPVLYFSSLVAEISNSTWQRAVADWCWESLVPSQVFGEFRVCSAR